MSITFPTWFIALDDTGAFIAWDEDCAGSALPAPFESFDDAYDAGPDPVEPDAEVAVIDDAWRLAGSPMPTADRPFNIHFDSGSLPADDDPVWEAIEACHR